MLFFSFRAELEGNYKMVGSFVNEGLLCRWLRLNSSRHGLGNEDFVSIGAPAGTPEPVKHVSALEGCFGALPWFVAPRPEFTVAFWVGLAG
jgi:hypothetical protein